MCFYYLILRFLWQKHERKSKTIECPENYIEILKKTTPLETGQILHLYRCFCNLGKGSTVYPPLHLRKSHFLSLTSLQRNPVLPMLLNSMFGDKKRLDFIEFAKYLSLFKACSSRLKSEQVAEQKQKKLRMLFNMYDHDKNGIITEEDLIHVIHTLFSDIWSSQQIVNVASTMMSEMDTTLTDKILFNDFCNALEIFDMENCLITKIPGSSK